MPQTALVSVIIPVFNCDKYLGEAIDSALQQTYQDYEVIVVDDGSSDGSLQIAKDFGSKVRVYDRPHGGAAAARNFGIRESKGELLAFLDSDDIWVEDKLSWQVSEFIREKDLDLCFGYYESFVSPELEENYKKSIFCPPGRMPGSILGTLMVKRTLFDKVGQLSTRWRVGEFVEWYAKAKSMALKEYMIDKVVLKRRIHKTNLGVLKKSARVDYVRILRESLARRNKEGGE